MMSQPSGDERPRKRARSQSPVVEIGRDPEYYFDDGSTIIRVKTVLFKVHRTILSKDSSVFQTMFDLPVPEGATREGGSDNNPIILPGDTPEQFRSLLWALYAMPHEIIQAGSAQEDWPEFDRFCDLAYIAHKYGFRSLQTWAFRSFSRWLLPHPRYPAHTPTAATSAHGQLDRLQRLLELAVLCEDRNLHDTAVDRLQEELRNSNADLPWFIALAERFEMTSLSGTAYYSLMIQGRDKWLSLASAGRLTRTQLGRLHNGFYAFVSKWQALRALAPPLQNCTHNCKARWDTYWNSLMKDDNLMAKFPADVVSRLAYVQSRVFINTAFLDMHRECRTEALTAVGTLVYETREGLASQFVDLL